MRSAALARVLLRVLILWAIGAGMGSAQAAQDRAAPVYLLQGAIGTSQHSVLSAIISGKRARLIVLRKNTASEQVTALEESELFSAVHKHEPGAALPIEQARLTQLDILALAGGDYLQWHDTLGSRGSNRHFLDAVKRERKRGLILIVDEAAAPFFAGAAIIERERLNRPLRNPRKAGEKLMAVGGIGLLGGALLETSASGDFARAFDVARRADLGLVWFLEGDVLLRFDARPARVQLHGAGRLFVLDGRGARRLRGSWTGLRLDILPASEAAEPAIPLPKKRRVLPLPIPPGKLLPDLQAGALDPAHWPWDELDSPAAAHVLRDARQTLTLSLRSAGSKHPALRLDWEERRQD